jgi:hypothetical protein
MRDMFSTTPVDLRQAVKTSWRPCKRLSVISRGRGGCGIDCTQYGLFPWGLSTYSFRFTKLLFRYCIPMDNNRPALDLRHFDDICPDKNGASKYNLMNWGLKREIFPSSCDSSIHQVRPVQAWHRF